MTVLLDSIQSLYLRWQSNRLSLLGGASSVGALSFSETIFSFFCSEGSMKSRLSKPLLNFYSQLWRGLRLGGHPGSLTRRSCFQSPALPSHATLLQEAAILCQPGAAEALEDRKLPPRLSPRCPQVNLIRRRLAKQRKTPRSYQCRNRWEQSPV